MRWPRYIAILLMLRSLAFVAGWIVASAQVSLADVAVRSSFLATKDCPAFQSFRKATNPGGVRTEAGHSYPLLAKNAPHATHYRVRIEGAAPPERWVSVTCGNYWEETANSGLRDSEPAAALPADNELSLFYPSAGSPLSVRTTTTNLNARVRP